MASLGLGAFGPVDIDPASRRFGHILNTPKAGWSGVDLVGPLRAAFRCPVRIDTDVNAAAIGEARWGGARDVESSVYVTIGTGVGAGAIHHGRPVHGLMHPEVGHIRVLRHPADEEFAGICPFHGDCRDGLISGAAIPELMPPHATIPVPLSRGRRCPAQGEWCPAKARSRARRLAS